MVILMDYEELKGEIEDVEFGNMSINDCIYYNEVLDELGYAQFDENGYIINEFNPRIEKTPRNYQITQKRPEMEEINNKIDEYQKTHTKEVMAKNLDEYKKKHYNYDNEDSIFDKTFEDKLKKVDWINVFVFYIPIALFFIIIIYIIVR